MVKRLGRGMVAVAVAALAVAAMGCLPRRARVQRYGSVIGIEAEKIAEYKRLHAAVWPTVLRKLEDAGIRNYSIYLAQVEDDTFYLFSYFEYTGRDFEADMARMAADPEIKRWWKHTDPLQVRVATCEEGEWWHTIEEVFHME